MKKSLFFAIALMSAAILTSCGGDTLTPQGDKTQLWPAQEDYGDLYGFINAQGKWVIKPQYYYVSSFSCGWCLVLEEGEDGEWKFIDKNNHASKGFEEEYLADEYFYYNRLTMKEDGYYGKYDTYFNIVVKPEDYKYLGPTADNGYSVFSEDNKNYGYIDLNGKKVIDDDFYSAYDFADGIAVVEVVINGTYKMGVIDANCKYLIDPQSSKLLANLGEGRVGYYSINKKICGMMDKNGNELVEPRYTILEIDYDKETIRVPVFSCGLLKVSKDGEYGFINTKGNEVIDTRYYDASDFAEDVAWVRKNQNSRIELIDKKGESILTLKEGESAGLFHNGLALVYSSRKENGIKIYTYRYINKKGEQIYKWESYYAPNEEESYYAPEAETLSEMSRREMMASPKGYLFDQKIEVVR